MPVLYQSVVHGLRESSKKAKEKGGTTTHFTSGNTYKNSTKKPRRNLRDEEIERQSR